MGGCAELSACRISKLQLPSLRINCGLGIGAPCFYITKLEVKCKPEAFLGEISQSNMISFRNKNYRRNFILPAKRDIIFSMTQSASRVINNTLLFFPGRCHNSRCLFSYANQLNTLSTFHLRKLSLSFRRDLYRQ